MALNLPFAALGRRSASLVLLACLFSGLFAGGLRDPLLAAPVLAFIWIAALLGPQPSWLLFRPWLFFLGWAILSLLANPQPLSGLAVVSRWAALAGFFCLAASWWNEEDRRSWFWGLAIGGLALAAASFLLEDPGYPKVGVLPPYYNYTVFVEAALFSAALAAALRRDGPRAAGRWACWGLVLFALSHILWSCSRGGLLAAAGGGAIFAWRNSPRRRLLTLAPIAALALAGGLVLATMAKLDVARSFKRPQIGKAALLCALDHPVFGAGPGQFANAFLTHNFPAGYGVGNYRARAEHAHSEVLEAAAEFGLPGLILLLAALRLSWRPARPRESSWTREAALAAFAAMSVQCLADNMLHLPSLGLLYVSALAAARDTESDRQVAPSAWRSLALAGLVLAAVSWVPGRLLRRWEAGLAAASEPAARLELARRAAALVPADPYARERLAREWLGQKPPRPQEALRQLEEARRLSPFNAVYPVMEAEIRRQAGDWQGVLALAGEASRLEPDFIQARLLAAEGLLRLGRAGEGRAALAEACRIHLALEPRRRAAKGGFDGLEYFLFAFDQRRYEEIAALDPAQGKALGPGPAEGTRSGRGR